MKNSRTASIFFNLPLYQVNDGNKSWYILISSVALHFSDYDLLKSVLILSYDKNWSRYWNSTIDHHEKENIAKIGCITRALKPPSMPFSFWTPSSTEASNDEICQKPVVVLTYNTIKGFKTKQDMRYAGYSETEFRYCTLQEINLDWSTATSPIDSVILNQSVVTSPIDLENSN